MNPITIRLITIAALFTVMLLFGIWLSLAGKPYNAVLMSVHKILALAAAVVIVVSTLDWIKVTEMRASFWILIIFYGILYFITFISGVLLSFDKPYNTIIVIVHKISLIAAALSTGLMIYLATKLVKI